MGDLKVIVENKTAAFMIRSSLIRCCLQQWKAQTSEFCLAMLAQKLLQLG